MAEKEGVGGEIKIRDEVIAAIATKAALSVEGVAGMSGGIVDGLAEALGRKGERGVRVELKDNRAKLDLYIIAKYGFKMIDVAREVQRRVKEQVEEFTGLAVEAVNVIVQGIEFEKGGGADEGV